MIKTYLHRIYVSCALFLPLSYPLEASSWTTDIMKSSIEKAALSCGVPEDLLYAIAKVESNLWPWSVHLKGKSYYFATKAEAVEFATDRQKNGVHGINAGLMQIYWPAHRKNIKNFDELFDPDRNVLFAAKLLQKLKKQHGSWGKAVKAYHSSIEKYGTIYGKKISRELGFPLETM